jgi:hypothetical protein
MVLIFLKSSTGVFLHYQYIQKYTSKDMKNKILSPSKRLYGKFVTFLLYSIDFYVDPDFSHKKLVKNGTQRKKMKRIWYCVAFYPWCIVPIHKNIFFSFSIFSVSYSDYIPLLDSSFHLHLYMSIVHGPYNRLLGDKILFFNVV